MATEHGSEPAKNSPAPRWRDALAAVGVAVGIVMGVVAYFVPKAEAPKPQAAASVPAVSVTVSGSGAVGVGTMSGGQIVMNAPAAVPASGSRP